MIPEDVSPVPEQKGKIEEQQMIKAVEEARNYARDSDDEDVGDQDPDEDSATEVEDNDKVCVCVSGCRLLLSCCSRTNSIYFTNCSQ